MIFMTFTTKPMEHQQKAIDKLSKTKVGALYMDMGTGKTRTALGLAVPRLLEGKVDCILWLCPVSVKQTIADEIQKHLPDATFEIISTSGIKDMNANIYIAGIESLSQSLSLDFILLDLVSKKRCFVVVDESSLVKNHMAKRTRSIWRLGERSTYKLILNGTPISNNEQDLYSQWYFLNPRILGYTSFYSFAANHLEYDPRIPGRVVRAHNVEYLVAKMSNFVYQVRKDECLELPPKTYTSRHYYMTDKQKEVYESTKEYVFDLLLNYDIADISTMIFRLFNDLQKVVSGKTYNWHGIFKTPYDNPRVKLLLETIEELPEDNKVIIWCKYTHEIEMVANVLREQGYKTSRLYGDLSLRKREAELKNFRKDAQFLIANKHCGAFGLNLQFANYAIYYSNDFSWATRSQSEDRIHRTGQTQNVHIIDLICNDSIDQRIYRCLIDKESLVDSFKREIDKQKDLRALRTWIDGRE